MEELLKELIAERERREQNMLIVTEEEKINAVTMNQPGDYKCIYDGEAYDSLNKLVSDKIDEIADEYKTDLLAEEYEDFREYVYFWIINKVCCDIWD